MNDNKNGLSEHEISTIKNIAFSKLNELGKIDEILGIKVFSIIESTAKLIYYPLGKNAPWGFTYITKTAELNEKIFVVLNSSIGVDCQVFAAAHELYHIWYDRKPDIITSNDLDYATNQNTERMASRFAAEFLVNEKLLKKEINSSDLSPKDILKLSELFMVPYKTIVRRLYETGIISLDDQDTYLMRSNSEILIIQNRYSNNLMKPNQRISIADHVDLAIKAYEHNLITYEKLEYFLNKSQLKPRNVGINENDDYCLPTDEELDAIMGD